MSDIASIAWAFWERMSRGETDKAVELLDDEGTWWTANHDARFERPMIEMKQFFKAIGERVPMTFKLHHALVSGDRAALEIESHAETDKGRYNNCYCMVVTVRDGRIVRVHEYVDTKHAYEVLMPVIDDLIRMR